jgi:AP-1 complex subunit sigma 1/2
VSRQGKTRLTKWFVQKEPKVIYLQDIFLLLMVVQDKTRSVRELTGMVLSRPPKLCNFLEWRDKKVVYKRLVSLEMENSR